MSVFVIKLLITGETIATLARPFRFALTLARLIDLHETPGDSSVYQLSCRETDNQSSQYMIQELRQAFGSTHNTRKHRHRLAPTAFIVHNSKLSARM